VLKLPSIIVNLSIFLYWAIMMQFIQNFQQHLFEWIALLLCIVALIYTAWAVKNEKVKYFKTAKKLPFGGFSLLIPGWWGKKEMKEGIAFHRTDTYYDWEAQYQLIPGVDSPQDIEKKLVSDLEKKEIIFDLHQTEIYPLQTKTDPLGNKFFIVRIEGTATQSQEKRVYCDSFIAMKENNQDRMLLGHSLSSILNGGIEGPYFEQIIDNLEINP
jgi:hypothetical protein